MSAVSWQHAGQVECPLCDHVNEWPVEWSFDNIPGEGSEVECADCLATILCVGTDIFDAEDGGSPSGAWYWEAKTRARSRDEIATEDAKCRHEESPYKHGET